LGGTGVRLKRPSTGLQEPGNDLSAPAVASTTGPTEDSIRTGPQRHLRQIVCSLSRQAVSLMTPVSASTSTSVRRRSATSSRRLGFQSCNGPQTPAPRGPKRPNRDAERRFSHAVRFSAESANSFQSFRRLADVAAVPTIGEARCLLPFGGRVTALGGVAED
jgi:hypothetical protein